MSIATKSWRSVLGNFGSNKKKRTARSAYSSRARRARFETREMQRIEIVVVVLLLTAVRGGFAQEADVETLIAESNPAIQEQLTRSYVAFLAAPANDLKINCEAFQELQKLKYITKDKGEIVKQLAIFIAITESEEESHVMLTGIMLNLLDLPASIPIRVLAPYLDSENEKLRGFARGWFYYHDSHDRIHGRPPLGSVNYYDYMQYVHNRIARNEDVPVAFIRFIYERHPGKALLVFAYANRAGDIVAQLHAIRKNLEAARQGREKTPDEIRQQREKKLQEDVRRHQAKTERGEILLAEHIISNSLWLKENKFEERFQKAQPEAAGELAKLAKHKEWWARLYVAKIMRRNPELRDAGVMERLGADSDALVSKAAKSVKE